MVSLKGEFLSNSTSVVWLYITTEKLKKKKEQVWNTLRSHLGLHLLEESD